MNSWDIEDAKPKCSPSLTLSHFPTLVNLTTPSPFASYFVMKLNIYHPSVKERKRIGSAAGGPKSARNGLYRNRPPRSSAGGSDTGSLVSSHSPPQEGRGQGALWRMYERRMSRLHSFSSFFLLPCSGENFSCVFLLPVFHELRARGWHAWGRAGDFRSNYQKASGADWGDFGSRWENSGQRSANSRS